MVGKQVFPPKDFQVPWSYELKEEQVARVSPDLLWKSNTQIIKNNIHNRNLDSVHLTFGEEGTGKTSLSIQEAVEIDPQFANQNLADLPQVPFSVKQFKEFIEEKRSDNFYEGRRGVAILFDEGNLVANARKALTKENIEFTSLLTQMRAEFGFFAIFNFQSFRFAETYLKNDRCRSASRCFFRFDRNKMELVSGQAHYYNKPLIRQIKKNTSTGQIEFPSKSLFTRSFKTAHPFKLWKAINEKKYLHLLDMEEQTKTKSTRERRISRLNTLIMVEKLEAEPNKEKIKTLTDELRKLLIG